MAALECRGPARVSQSKTCASLSSLVFVIDAGGGQGSETCVDAGRGAGTTAFQRGGNNFAVLPWLLSGVVEQFEHKSEKSCRKESQVYLY